MATRAVLLPQSAEFVVSPFPQLYVLQNRMVLGFDDTLNEGISWTLIVPSDGLTGPVYAVVSYFMASATSGTVGWGVEIEAVSAGDATDLDSTTSYDTMDSASGSVPGTAGYLGQATIPISHLDSAAANDYLRLLLTRRGSTDSAAGDAYLLAVELRDSA